MAPMKQKNNNSSSNHYAGQDILRQANILASCYSVDAATGSLKGLHYCTTGVTGAECPPLAAINTSTNELALTPKPRKSAAEQSSTGRRRGGATLRIREECERFFCETLRAMFLGERNEAMQGSIMTARVLNHNYNNTYDQQMTPPDDYPVQHMGGGHYLPVGGTTTTTTSAYGTIPAWLEIWDYVGGSSFRAFIAEDLSLCTKTSFVFFDSHVMNRDLKQALVALIELAEGPLDCTHMVIAIDRSIEQEEARALTKGLQWAGFSLTTLDFWTPAGLDVVSDRWVFMGMEV